MRTHDKSILTGLADLSAGPVYPMHMPGHKRRDLSGMGLPCSYDITEITGFDDLHAPKGLLKEAMERAAALFGAKRTFFLVNGSTCGILAAIGSIVKHGDRVIAARNCHSSVFHAIQVMDLAVSWVLPAYLSEYGIFGSVGPEAVEKALRAFPQAKAVIITSPTYEGVLSDISSIAAICHKAGALLIVDEAHGASLPFYEKSGYRGEFEGGIPFRELSRLSALSCQADLIVQSAHKTLPALTQTAFLHIGRDSSFSDEERIREQLSVYETSSPSYLFLASLDECTGLIARMGTELYSAYEENLAFLYSALSGLRKLRVFSPSVSSPGCFQRDPGKLLVNGREAGFSGAFLGKTLRERFLIEPEMVCGDNVLLFTSIADTKEGFIRLSEALLSLEKEAQAAGALEERNERTAPRDPYAALSSFAPEPALSLTKAFEAPCETVPLSEALWRICAEYISLYPPGIPFLVPGERITEALLSVLKDAESAAQGLRKSRSTDDPGTVAVVTLPGIS